MEESSDKKTTQKKPIEFDAVVSVVFNYTI